MENFDTRQNFVNLPELWLQCPSMHGTMHTMVLLQFVGLHEVEFRHCEPDTDLPNLGRSVSGSHVTN